MVSLMLGVELVIVRITVQMVSLMLGVELVIVNGGGRMLLVMKNDRV
jgi:hypothetical protein